MEAADGECREGADWAGRVEFEDPVLRGVPRGCWLGSTGFGGGTALLHHVEGGEVWFLWKMTECVVCSTGGRRDGMAYKKNSVFGCFYTEPGDGTVRSPNGRGWCSSFSVGQQPQCDVSGAAPTRRKGNAKLCYVV